jgi:hypothetical protein
MSPPNQDKPKGEFTIFSCGSMAFVCFWPPKISYPHPQENTSPPNQTKPFGGFIVLSYISIALSITIFGLSLVDKGLGSRYTNIVMPILTVIYHIVSLTSHYCFIKRTDGANDAGRKHNIHPAGTIINIVCAGCLTVLWYLPYGILITSLPHAKNALITLWVQMMLDPFEAAMLGPLCGGGIDMRWPTMWRLRIGGKCVFRVRYASLSLSKFIFQQL